MGKRKGQVWGTWPSGKKAFRATTALNEQRGWVRRRFVSWNKELLKYIFAMAGPIFFVTIYITKVIDFTVNFKKPV